MTNEEKTEIDAETDSQNTMKPESKPTPGPWTLTHPGLVETSILGEKGRIVVGGGFDGIMSPFVDGDEETSLANAELIAEAGTVYHETGLTPREILNQRDQLLRVAQAFVDSLDLATAYRSCESFDWCELVGTIEAIQESKPKGETPA